MIFNLRFEAIQSYTQISNLADDPMVIERMIGMGESLDQRIEARSEIGNSRHVDGAAAGRMAMRHLGQSLQLRCPTCQS